jgi:Aspartyl protease
MPSYLQKILPSSIPPRVLICVVSLFWSVSSSATNKYPLDPTIGFLCRLSFPQAAVTDVNTIYIPFQLVGQLMMVEARVDTVTGLFIVDTGSERLVLNKEYYTAAPDARTVVAIGNTGLVPNAIEKYVDSISMDQLVVYDLYAHLIDLHHIELKKNIRMMGILGYKVFEDFELFLDFQNRRIVLSRLNAKGIRVDTMARWELPYDSMDFELKKHLIVVETEVNSVRLKMILDSGAELNLIDRRIHRKVLDQFSIIKRVNLIGAGKREVEVLAGVLKDVRCGNQYAEKMNTLLTSLDEINHSFGVNVQGVLGYEFLKKRRVLINYKKRKLYFFNPVRS